MRIWQIHILQICAYSATCKYILYECIFGKYIHILQIHIRCKHEWIFGKGEARADQRVQIDGEAACNKNIWRWPSWRWLWRPKNYQPKIFSCSIKKYMIYWLWIQEGWALVRKNYSWSNHEGGLMWGATYMYSGENAPWSGHSEGGREVDVGWERWQEMGESLPWPSILHQPCLVFLQFPPRPLLHQLPISFHNTKHICQVFP